MSISKTVITKLNSEKLKKSFLELPSKAKEQSWKLYYDKQADSLTLAPKVIPANNVLFSITRELNIFVNSSSNINGLFIENFSTNFVKHNTDFEHLIKTLNKRVNDDVYTVKDSNSSDLYTKALEASLLEKINEKKDLLYPDLFA